MSRDASHRAQPVRRTRLYRLLLALFTLTIAAVGSQGPTSQPARDPSRGLPDVRVVPSVDLESTRSGRASNCTGEGAPYPRTATYFLEQHRLPAIRDLARYDVVVLDSEWEHRVPQHWFERLRAADPGVCLLAYVNLVDHPDRLGTRRYWADRYSLWQFRNGTESSFPRRWLATTASGQVVSEWPETSMVNLTAHAPEVGGETYAEYAANWVAERVWATGVWDGVFLDVWGDHIWSADLNAWDSNGDGSDEPSDRIYGAGNPWGAGVDRAERMMRARMPGAIVVANGDRSLRDGQLDGLVWEGFVDPKSGRSPASDLRGYVLAAAEGDHRLPGLSLTINVRREARGSSTAAQAARFQLASTLMQSGFWAPMGQDYGELAFYGEMGSGHLQRGYLGSPISPNPTWAALEAPFHAGVGRVGPQVFRRDFGRGIVLLNAGTRPRTVSLEESYRRVPGLWGSPRDDNRRIASVTVPAMDALVLLRP